jgi:hypothetical protein
VGASTIASSINCAIDKEQTMTIKSICLISGLALAAALPASAQSNDQAYCNALIVKYQQFLEHSGSSRHSGPSNNAAASVAIDKCKAGDYSGIPALERELQNDKLELPSRS